MNSQHYINQHIPPQLSIQHVALLRPFNWLTLAWQDFTHHPTVSLSHGLIVTGLMFITLLITSVHVYIIAAAISGFMLIGPILSAGLCELSRQREQGKTVSFDSSVQGLRQNQGSLAQFAAILLGVSLLWFLLSGLVLLATTDVAVPSLQQLLWGNIFDAITTSQLLIYMLIGSLLASLVFIISVVSVPAIIDNNLSPIDAMAVSTKVIFENLPTMLFWAGLIVLLTAIGFATYLIGMIVIYPLLSHATWHAYRDLVDSKN